MTEMMEEHKKKLVNSHEIIAEMKLRKTEMSVCLEDESTKFNEQEQELVGLKEELEKLKQDLKEINASLKSAINNKSSLVQEIRVLREQLEFLAERDTEDERTKKAQQRVLALKRLESDRKEVE